MVRSLNGSRRAAFLDRDGVINAMCWDPEFGTVDSPANPEQFRLLSGVAEGIETLRSMGLLVIVVSNQPGIAKGKMIPELLHGVTKKMHVELARAGTKLDGVYYCLHHPQATLPEYRVICGCRKPKPGLLLQAAKELNIDLVGSVMIGDGMTDIEAGRAAGCTTLWLGKMKCDQCTAFRSRNTGPDLMAESLPEAARLILEMAR
jgi:D-glycero-D-manno-heptose 1,7-bisphosphate phosphatase